MSITVKETEHDIFFELEEIERIIDEETNNYMNVIEYDSGSPYYSSDESISVMKTPHRHESSDIHKKLLNISSYELAAAEGEKEQLQDKINILLRKHEENQKQISQIMHISQDLRHANKELTKENTDLKNQLLRHNASQAKEHSLEVLFAEACMKLAQTEKMIQDSRMANDSLKKELQHEQQLRIHVGQLTPVLLLLSHIQIACIMTYIS